MTISTYNFKTLQSKLLLIFCLFVYSSNFSQEANTSKKGKTGILSFETEEIDYGTIQQNANGERTFKFTNTGKAPIVITNVKTSCGCTVPSYAKTPILPGDSSEIKIKYATNRIGIFKKTITIISNASESSKILRIKGKVLKPEAPKS
ncbi:DUF1573 domain-containing protein [Snuella lapsa]|uniref:DUF1573 domain-containing protein n=1 Tax=Snuella lapsa TaxID=870481 RepID=A0ABP6YB68_9FLAO